MENKEKDIADGLLNFAKESQAVLATLEKNMEDVRNSLSPEQAKKLEEELKKMDIDGAKKKLNDGITEFNEFLKTI